jgi:hypothetical protein
MKPEPKNTSTIENKGGKPPVVDPASVKQDLDAIGAKADEALAALRNTPTADEIKAIKDSIEAVKTTVEGLPYADHSTLIKTLEGRVDELQTGAALLGTKAADQPAGIKAITQKIFDSELYKSIFDADGNPVKKQLPTTGGAKGNWTERTEIESFAAAGFKAPSPVVISDMAGGTTEVFKPGTVFQRDWAMDIMSRIPTVITRNAATYTVPKETQPSRYGAWKTTVAVAINGDPTPTSTAELTDTKGCMLGSTHRFYHATTNALLGTAVVVSFVPATNVVTYVTNSLDFDAAIGSKVVSENYAAIAELGEKPNQFVGTENESFTLKTLASILPTTVQALNTIMGLQALIERKMPIRDRRNMSRHLIYGDGTADELQGLRTYTGAQSYNWSSGVSGDNQVDAIMRAINLIPWGVPISVIMSQVDLPALFLLKGSDGHYLRTGNFGQVPLTQVGLSWFLGAHELVFDHAVASGDFTPINFGGASEIADQDTASFQWGYIDDDFVKNIIRARYEATRAHAILDAQEFVVGEWDAAP